MTRPGASLESRHAGRTSAGVARRRLARRGSDRDKSWLCLKGSGWTLWREARANGVWSNGNNCRLATNVMGMLPDGTYRIAVTARNKLDVTRKMSITTFKPADTD